MTKWEDLEADAMYAMLGSTEAMQGFEGAMEKINQVRFDTFGKAVQGIGRMLFMDIVYPIGEAILPALNILANYLSGNLPSAIEKTKATLKAITPIVLGMVSAFLVYKGTLTAVAVAQTVFNVVQKSSIVLYNAHRAAMIAYSIYGGGVKGVTQGMAAAMRVLNISMLANPFVAVAAAVVGVGVAFYAAYKMSDTFRGAVNSAFASAKNFVINSANFISSNASMIWDGLITSAKEIPSRIQAALSNSAIGQMLSNLFDGNGIMDGLISSIKTGFSSLPGIFSMIAPMLTTLGLSFLGVSGPIGWVIGAIVSIGGFLFRLSQTNEGVASAMSGAWSKVTEAFAPVIQVFKDGISQIATEVGPELAKTIDVISSTFTELAPVFAELGTTIISAFSQIATMLASDVLPVLLQGFQLVLPMILSVISAVLPVAIQLLTSIIPVILNLAQIIIPLILSVVQMVFPMVLSIIQSVLPIIFQLLTIIVGTIVMLAQTILPILLQMVQMVFPIVLQIIQTVIPIVVMVLQTLVSIINSVIIPAINGILAIIQFVFPLVQTIISNALAIVNGLIQTAMALLKGDWDGAWSAIKQTAETIMNNIISFFQGINLFEVGKSIINGLIDGIKSMSGAVLSGIASLIPEPLKKAASGVMKALGVGGYAEGGIVTSPELAWIGEGGDTESVIPWNNSARSKSLWLQTGQALGMLDQTGAMDLPSQGTQQVMTELVASDALPDIRRRVELQQEAEDKPVISSGDVTRAVGNNSSTQIIELNYNPQYNVNNSEDLEKVQEFAERDKEDMMKRLEEKQHDERRTSFGD